MMTTTRRRLAAGATALALATALAACSAADDEPAAGAASPDGGATSEHNDADAQFAQMMIVHHEGAVEMSELAVERAETPEVRDLAERIAAAQGPEIELMSGWLTAWGEAQPGDMDMGGMDHGGMDMDGMDQEEAMGMLGDLDGAQFDERFLEMMTAHHEGAIEMAEEELEDGENADALDLAGTIIEDQTAEIAEMQEMLDGL